MSNDWPFDQPPNCAVITLRDIAENRAPVLHVTHDPMPAVQPSASEPRHYGRDDLYWTGDIVVSV